MPSRLGRLLRSIASYGVYPMVGAAAAVPSIRILGRSGAIAFGLAAIAWLLFGRLLVFAYFGYLLGHVVSPRTAVLLLAALVDVIAIAGALTIDRGLFWSAAAAIAAAEMFWLIAFRYSAVQP